MSRLRLEGIPLSLETSAIEIESLRRPCGCLRFPLTDREENVLELLASGMSTQQIGAALYISHQAVTYHVGNLLSKLQSSNRTELVGRAFVLGLLSLTWPPRIVTVASSDEHPRGTCSLRLKHSKQRWTSGWM